MLQVSVEDERVRDVKETSVPESRFILKLSLSTSVLILTLLPFDGIVRVISSSQGMVFGL